jgi:hypothetical protein
MEQYEDFPHMASNTSEGQDRSASQEVVFVLRVRAGSAGWWGQVHRLDVGSLRYVANHSELFAILSDDWDLVVNANSNEEQRIHE